MLIIQHTTYSKYHSYSKAWWWQHHGVGMFPAAGTGRLVRIEGIINAAMYRNILDEQNNDPKHRAKLSMAQLLQNNSMNVIEWPSQSPDWNLTEHLWRDLKMRGAAKRNE